MVWLNRVCSVMLCLGIFSAQADTCAGLKGKELSDGEIISAKQDAAICKVVARVWPSPLSSGEHSYIDVTVWLPDRDVWNQRVIGLGNGGYSPSLPQSAMQQQVQQGYVAAATDTGHKDKALTFIEGANERIDYWGRTSVHTLSVSMRAIASAYYGQAPDHTYFSGCSTGGHQAMTAAQYYPQDYDGIVAGAPGNNRVALNAAFLWLFQQTHNRKNQLLFNRQDLKLLADTTLKQCAGENGLIDDIERCQADPDVLTCNKDKSERCLTQEQVRRVKKIYQGPVDPVTGESIYPGFPPGSEHTGGVGWSAYWADPTAPARPARADFWQLWAFPDRTHFSLWDFDWHHDYNLAKTRLSHRIDATRVDLSAFTKKGGHLLLYHGLADPVVSALDTIDLYQRITKQTTNSSNIRLFVVPGMSHCQGGSGVVDADWLTPLVAWQEQGIEPSSVSGWTASQNHIEIKPYN